MSDDKFEAIFQRDVRIQPAVFDTIGESEPSSGSSPAVGTPRWAPAVFPNYEEGSERIVTRQPSTPLTPPPAEHDSETGIPAGAKSTPLENKPCPRCDELESSLAEAQSAAMSVEVSLTESFARQVEDIRFQLSRSIHLDVVELARKLAQEVIGKAVQEDTEILLRSVERALDAAGPIQAGTLVCHPDDENALKGHLNQMDGAGSRRMSLALESRDDMGRGGCMIRFPGGQIDARLESQLQQLTESVRDALTSPRGNGEGVGS